MYLPTISKLLSMKVPSDLSKSFTRASFESFKFACLSTEASTKIKRLILLPNPKWPGIIVETLRF